MYKVKIPRDPRTRYARELYEAEGLALEALYPGDIARIDKMNSEARWKPFGSVTLRRGLYVYECAEYQNNFC